MGDALIDTGASICAMDESAAAALGLNPVGQANVGGVGGSKSHNVYVTKISFPGTNLTPSEWTLVGADLRAQNLLLLIGGDVLRNCVLVYNGLLGVTTISL
jgi:predicted aspartyl protease